jgi:hypothetical protein
MTEKGLNLYQRILGIMSELHYIQKGEKTVNNQYRFVSHDQVTAAIHPLLVKYGVVILPSVEESLQEGNRTSVKLLVTLINADDPSESYTIRNIGYGVDSGDKGPGKAVSYAVKYAILKAFCLETGDDPDNDQSAVYEPPKCLEFEMSLPEMTDKEKVKLNKFLEHSASVMSKHVEDVKKEASKRMPEFLTALKNWNPKK